MKGRGKARRKTPPSREMTLPDGRRALRADPKRQNHRDSMYPLSHYVDMPRNCRQCRADFTFSAREQLHWYEELSISVNARPNYCKACRPKKRVERESQKAWRENLGALDGQDLDSFSHLSLARAALAFRPLTKSVLERGLEAARKAEKLGAHGASLVERDLQRVWQDVEARRILDGLADQ